MKKVLPWIITFVFITLIVIGISMRSKMNIYISELMKQQAGEEVVFMASAYVDSVFNYQKNRKEFELTFLEFGAKDCSACKRMESVLIEVAEKHPEINVVFLNALLPENQLLMKYYGIATIPTQVLLDINGKEFFRHDGYYSYKNLIKEFEDKLIVKN
jgi:thioredoxin 1